jgi:hypothetical protein
MVVKSALARPLVPGGATSDGSFLLSRRGMRCKRGETAFSAEGCFPDVLLSPSGSTLRAENEPSRECPGTETDNRRRAAPNPK